MRRLLEEKGEEWKNEKVEKNRKAKTKNERQEKTIS